MGIPTIEVFDRKEFRAWLRRNHRRENKVAVVLHKRHTGKPAPSHRQLMEEAICFGWIDTTVKRVDESTFVRHFSKRTKNSTWSDNTLRYARELIAQGKMTKEGMRFYEMGRAKPTHDHGIPKNPDMPEELKKSLSKNEKIQHDFDALAPSTKRTLYRWLLSAKRPETRIKRINRIMALVRAGQRDFF